MGYVVVIVGAASNQHVGAFVGPARVLEVALRQLGHDVGTFRCAGQHDLECAAVSGARVIALGGQHAAPLGLRLPADAIVYNLEQAGTGWFEQPHYVELCRRHACWDYGANNALALRRYGIQPCAIVPVADTAPSALQSFERRPPAEQDVDVVLVGYMNARRQAVVEQMRGLDLIVEVVDGSRVGDYGERRDELLARCKLAVNVHYYRAHAPLESARVAHLVANGVPVLSEESRDVEPWVTAWWAPYAGLADGAHSLVRRADPQAQLARTASAAVKLQAGAPALLRAVQRALLAAAPALPERPPSA